MKKKFDPFFLSLCLVCVITLSLTIGFSALSASTDIRNSKATILPISDIRVSGIIASSTTNSGTSYYEQYTDHVVYSSISLPNSDSTVTYNVQVTNIGNIEACIDAITGLPSNLQYTLNNYTLNDMLCDDSDNTKCKLGSTTTISITIGYKSNGYNSNNTNYSLEMDFSFQYVTNSVARIGDSYYSTLADAVTAVPTDGTQTTIVLLKDTSELITVPSTKRIIFNLNGRTLSNSGSQNVIINEGNITISNGTIFSNVDQGAINNEADATLSMISGSILVSGRQAIYNKGTLTISGTSYLKSTSTTRATVHSLAGSTTTITGGTIIATKFSSAVLNLGALTVGVKDGTSHKNTPVIQGATYGIDNTTGSIKFFDGIAKGKARGVKTDSNVGEIETGYTILTSTETISGEVFKTWYTAISNTVTFNPEGGSTSEATRKVEYGTKIGALPTPTKNGYDFVGWFTEGNEQVDANKIIYADIILHAHWNRIGDIAQIGNTVYESVQAAVNAAGTSTTTIKLLRNSKEQVTIGPTKKIILDLGNYTLSNNGNKSVIECKGTLSLISGTITSNTDTGAVNVVSGSFTMSGGSIIASGSRQALYITGGTATITGSAYLSSATDGAINGMERATVQNVSGTLIVTGGTIVATKQHAITNDSTMTIGVKDGNINAASPVITGIVDGIDSTVPFNFYDGIIKGKTNAIDGTVNDLETNSQIVNGMDGDYKTAHLEIPS